MDEKVMKPPYLSKLGTMCAVTVLAVLLAVAGFLWTLKKGINLERCRLGNVTVTQFHLQWDKKLEITIGQIDIVPRNNGAKPVFSRTTVRKAMVAFDLAAKYFEAIRVQKITMGDTVAAVTLNGTGSGTISITDPAYTLTSAVTYSGSSLTFVLEDVKSVAFNSQGSGTLRLDIVRNRFDGDFKLDLARALPLELHLEGDAREVSFEGKGTAAVHDIRPIVELFRLGPEIQPWITDYLKGDSFELQQIKGTVPFATPADVFRTLYGKAFVRGTEYSFEQKLPSIKAASTDVVFEHGVLKIYPHHTTYAGIDAGRSWLDINFGGKQVVLTAYIRTETGLKDEILGLLDFYNIHLPFKQTEGTADADLDLAINLETIHVTAAGHFKVSAGSFLYDQMTYAVTGAAISLVDGDVTIDDLHLEYGDTARMQVSGRLNISADKDDLHIAVNKFDIPLQNKRLFLDVHEKPLLLEYHRQGDAETLSFPVSSWKIGSVSAQVDAFTAPIHAAERSGTLSGVGVEIAPFTRAIVSGDFNLRTPGMHFDAQLQGWKSAGLLLDQPSLQMAIVYNGALMVSLDKESAWQIVGKKVRMSPLTMKYAEKKLTVNDAGLHLEDFLDSKLHGVFDTAAGKGNFVIDQVEIANLGKQGPDFSGRNLKANLVNNGGSVSASIPDLGISYQRSQTAGWAVHIEDLGKLYDHSNFLQRYRLNRGSGDIRQGVNQPLIFTGSITSPYEMLVKNNLPTGVFDIKGQYVQGILDVTVNDAVSLHYAGRMQITSDTVGYNFSAIRSFMEDHLGKPGEGAGEKIPDFDMHAERTVLYINPYQKASADTIRLHAENGTLTGQLLYGKVKAALEKNNAFFTLVGQDFGEGFLNGLLKDSRFIGGRLSFYVSGLLTKFRGVVKIEDSVMKNGIILNNIMAFISTVPDLMTFSLPGYSLQGMPFNELYAGFVYDNHVIDVTAFNVESNALDMTGVGKISLVENSIKMNIDLISKTKKYISKIPLLGYLLVGDEKQPTITLNVKGKLDDPEVGSSVYTEIVKTPFDILLRTISLPSRLLDQLGGSEQAPSGSGEAVGQGSKP